MSAGVWLDHLIMHLIRTASVVSHSRIAATTVLMHLLGTAAFGQSAQQSGRPPLTLATAIASAVAASPDVATAREAAIAARGRERQAAAIANPTVSYNREQTGSGALANSQDVLELEQPLELGGARGARTLAARFRREAAEVRVRATQSQVAYEATVAYANAVSAERRSKLASLIADSFAEAERVSSKRLNAGDASGFSVRRIRLEKTRYAVLRAEALLESRTAMLQLWSLLPADVDRSRLLELNLPAIRLLIAPNSADSAPLIALNSRPDIAALTLESRATTADANVARRERIPMPVIAAGAKRESVGGTAQGGIVAGLRFPLPLWDRRAGNVEAYDAEARRWTAELAAARRRAGREIVEASDALRTAEQQLDTMTPQIAEDAAATLRAAQAAYAEGEISLLEWLDANRAYHEVEASFASIRSQYVIRAATLARALGTILTLDAR